MVFPNRNHIGLWVCGWGLLCLLLATQTSQAQMTSTLEASATKAQQKKWSFVGVMIGSRSLHQSQDPHLNSGSSLVLIPRYQWDESLQLGAVASLSQGLTDETKTSLSNVKLYGRGPSYSLGSNLKFTPQMGLRLPTNEDDRVKGSYYSGFSLEPKLALSTGLLQGLYFYYHPTFNKNFHKYDRAENAQANISHSISQTAGMDLPISKKLGLNFELYYLTAWTYKNTSRSFFELSQTISFAASPNLILALGHSNSGRALDPSGRHSNVQFFDENHSTVFASMTLIQ